MQALGLSNSVCEASALDLGKVVNGHSHDGRAKRDLVVRKHKQARTLVKRSYKRSEECS